MAARRPARWLYNHAPERVQRLAARTVRRARRSGDGAWASGASHEMDHWRRVFAEDREHVNWLTWADAPVVPGTPLHRVLSELGVPRPRVLDVGAGPITPLGHLFEGTPIDLVAVDALADEYDALLDEFGIDPPTRTIKGDGEHLAELFEPGSFDVACACNALDHCYDPLLVIAQMIEVVRDGGRILLDHWANEGERRLYRGMHLWNVDTHDGHLVLWDPDRRVDVTDEFAARADFRVERNGERIVAVASKRAG